MEKRSSNKNSHQVSRRKKVIATKHLVVCIPLVAVLDRISIDIPTITVPIRIHSPEFCTLIHQDHCDSNTRCRCILFGALKARQNSAPILFFFKSTYVNSCSRQYPEQFSKHRYLRRCVKAVTVTIQLHTNTLYQIKKTLLLLCKKCKVSKGQRF